MNQRLRVIGVYRINVDDSLIQESIEIKFPRESCSDSERRKARSIVLAELSSVALIEVTIQGVDERFSIADFGQPDSDQVAYMETYLSNDGLSVISEDEQPAGDFLRIVFFIHYLDFTLPLQTSYGMVEVPRPSAMPSRLGKIIRYDPVD